MGGKQKTEHFFKQYNGFRMLFQSLAWSVKLDGTGTVAKSKQGGHRGLVEILVSRGECGQDKAKYPASALGFSA